MRQMFQLKGLLIFLQQKILYRKHYALKIFSHCLKKTIWHLIWHQVRVISDQTSNNCANFSKMSSFEFSETLTRQLSLSDTNVNPATTLAIRRTTLLSFTPKQKKVLRVSVLILLSKLIEDLVNICATQFWRYFLEIDGTNLSSSRNKVSRY